MTKVGVVDDHAVVRQGLKAFFAVQGDLEVVGEAASGREALELVRKVAMDVLVLDLQMPGRTGLEVLASVRAAAPHVAVLVLSGLPEEQYALSLIRQGASSFLGKDCDPREIVQAVRKLARGERYFSESVASLLASRTVNRDKAPASHERFSLRQLQVFVRLAKGETQVGIAAALSLSPKTVCSYRTQITRKLGLRSNSEFTRYALEHNLLN